MIVCESVPACVPWHTKMNDKEKNKPRSVVHKKLDTIALDGTVYLAELEGSYSIDRPITQNQTRSRLQLNQNEWV